MSGSAPIRWGIVGAGGIARTVGQAIANSPGSEVRAIAARDPHRAGVLAEDLGARSSYGSYDDLYREPEVDIVYVATVNSMHYQQALAALRAGKPVLVEKPLTVTAAAAARLAAEAQVRGLFLAEALWTRYLPLVTDAVALVRTGAIGDVLGVRSTLARGVAYDPTHRLWDPAVGGGVLLDLGIYVAHLAALFVGLPDRVDVTGRLAASGVDSTAVMLWSCDGDRYAQLMSSFDGWADEVGTVVSGSHGVMSFSGPTQVPKRADIARSGRPVESLISTDRPGGYLSQITEVERCLRSGLTESPLAPLDATIGVLSVLEAARSQLGLSDGELDRRPGSALDEDGDRAGGAGEGSG